MEQTIHEQRENKFIKYILCQKSKKSLYLKKYAYILLMNSYAITKITLAQEQDLRFL